MVDEKKEDGQQQVPERGIALIMDILSDEHAWMMAYVAARTARPLTASAESVKSLVQACAEEADLASAEFKSRFRDAEDEPEAPEPSEEKEELGEDGNPKIAPPVLLRAKKG